MYKLKFRAALIHFCFTLLVAVVAGFLVFFLWYPGNINQMLHGADMYMILLVLELGLGPAISLVIFNPNKTWRHLCFDYSIVCAIQISALLYGLHSISISRPVFIVFVKDGLRVVSAVELKAEDLAQAISEYRRLSWTGPQLVCINPPVNPQEAAEVMLSAFEGKDIQRFPKYYRACEAGEVEKGSRSSKNIAGAYKKTVVDVAKASGLNEFKWLPVISRFGNWVAVYENDINSVTYLNFDPFSKK